jgi:putative two-component system response regulator
MQPVLVVDDDDVTRAFIEHTLACAGHEVHTACDGQAALEIIRRDETRLVVSDWEMPRLNGDELCREIRAADLSAYVYVILLTSRSGPEEVVEGLRAGADDFIGKPFNPEELVVRVRAGERVLALETRDLTIFALARLAESRDSDTGAHLERVQSFSKALAQHLALRDGFRTIVDPEFVRLIYLTSPLHDIGKVGVPDCVLLKPGQLNEREFDIMKLHTTLGAQTLSAAMSKYPHAKFLQMARDIAATHHERFNGTGYPQGLRGDAIPLAGRIVALADVYDALTSRRVYKPAFTHEVARSMIVAESGQHFDPEVVAAFLSAEVEFQAINERFSRQLPTDRGTVAALSSTGVYGTPTLPPSASCELVATPS